MIIQEGPETVCGFIAEPVMGAAACVAPPEGYFEEIQEVLKRHDVLFIADEVITGFGRLGTWFATEKYGLDPDLMTLSKGITSAYVPLSASVISDRVWEVLHEGSKDIPDFRARAHRERPSARLRCRQCQPCTDGARGHGWERGVDRRPISSSQLEERCGDHPLMGEIRGRRPDARDRAGGQ